MCPLLALPLPRAFFQQSLTELTNKQGRQYVQLISLSFLDVYVCYIAALYYIMALLLLQIKIIIKCRLTAFLNRLKQ